MTKSQGFEKYNQIAFKMGRTDKAYRGRKNPFNPEHKMGISWLAGWESIDNECSFQAVLNQTRAVK